MEEINSNVLWDTVLLNTFIIEKKKCKVYFHRGTFIWENEAPPHTRNTLLLDDVIAVDYMFKKQRCCHNNKVHFSKPNSSQEFSNITQPVGFCIHYALHEKQNKWRHHKLLLTTNETRHTISWVNTLQALYKGLLQRPKQIIVFVNPFGGKRKGLQIYEQIAKPLFDIAGIEIDLTVTQRANHARDILESEDLSKFDGIVCVGGDGTFSEIMNGLLIRTARDEGIDPNNLDNELPRPKLRIGVIPGGSTDTVAYCIHGTTDIETAVLHVIIGESAGLDVSSVHNEHSLLCYYASVISYGYLGDIIRDSDKFRWMGPKRYDFSGFKKFLVNQGYEGEIMLATNSSNAPEDSKCFKDCQRCLSQKDIRLDDDTTQDWKTIRGKFLMVNGANLSCACPRSPNGISPHCHMGDGCLDLVLVKHTSLINNLRLLLTLSNKMKTIYDLPFVEVHRTKRFSFRALPLCARTASDVSVWNCDGEILFDTFLQIRSHCQLLQVFFRGIEASLDDNQRCSCF
uniref:DAGKc domain-containing protein n=1 Tax=Clastoptera arizonana TaxID=38151 RepID=A0A1B6D226_9HEMI